MSRLSYIRVSGEQVQGPATNVVLDMMNRAWQIKGSLEIKAIGDNVFFFQFSNRLDLLMESEEWRTVACGL